MIQLYDIADQDRRNDTAFPHAFEFPDENEANGSGNYNIQHIKLFGALIIRFAEVQICLLQLQCIEKYTV